MHSLKQRPAASGLAQPPSLKGLYFTDSEIAGAMAKKPGTPGSILRASLELPTGCNFNCIYCCNRSGIPKKGGLTTGEMKDYVSQVHGLGARSLTIPGWGEPGTRQDMLLEIAGHAAGLGMVTVVYSNASLLSVRLARELYDCDASLLLKLNSLDAATQDFMAGKSDSAELIRKGWWNAIRAGFNKSSPSRLAFETVICRPNISGIPDLWRHARDQNIVPMIETMTPVGNAADNRGRLGVPRSRLRALLEKLSKIDAEEFGFSWTPQVPFTTGPCEKYAYNVFATYLGEIIPCIATRLVAGNVREKPLGDILKTPLLSFTRQVPAMLREQGRPLGCRARAFALSKKQGIFERLLDDDPLAW